MWWTDLIDALIHLQALIVEHKQAQAYLWIFIGLFKQACLSKQFADERE